MGERETGMSANEEPSFDKESVVPIDALQDVLPLTLYIRLQGDFWV